jgi:hypothetical protein
MAKCDLKIALETAQKDAMRARDKARLGTIRLMLADIKRIEVDERIDVDDARVLSTLDKMVKQRRDSISQFNAAGRDELVAQEELELAVIQSFLPTQLNADEIAAMIDKAIANCDASGMQAMGKVMAELKPQLQGRADIGKVSGEVKQRLTASQ